MSFLKKITSPLSDLSTALAQEHVTHGHCHHCERETRWIVHREDGGFVRCTNCQDQPKLGV